MTRISKSHKLKSLAILSLLTGIGFATSAAAAPIYLENFDTGASLSTDPLVNYAAISNYWKSPGALDGLIVQNAGPVSQDAGGTGYFLFENTSGNPPAGETDFFSSADFNVTANTDYMLSFDVVNQSTCEQPAYNFTHCAAILQPAINGQNLGTPFSADDSSIPEPWVTYTFLWNSGNSVLAHLDLYDTFTSGVGNDFGVDDIRIDAVPEPATLSLIGLSLAGLAVVMRKRRA